MLALLRVTFGSLAEILCALARLPGSGTHGRERAMRAVNALFARCERAGVIEPVPEVDLAYPAYSELRVLEAGFAAIREECSALLVERDRLVDVERLGGAYTAGGHRRIGWKAFMLKARTPVTENCALCPRTARLVAAVPGIHNAFFSVLDAHQHVAPHWGYYKGFVRYHLGVIVPRDNADLRCFLRVNADPAHNARRDPRLIEAGRKHYWREGEGVMFDDTNLHDAHNDADGVRVVLFVDVVRRLPPLLALVNRAVIAAAYLLVPELAQMGRAAVALPEPRGACS